MKELHEFHFTNHIIVRDRIISVNVFTSTPDGVSYLEFYFSNCDIEELTAGGICDRVHKLYTLIYQHIVMMSKQCDIDLGDETIEVRDNDLIFKFYGIRKEQ